MIKAAVLADVAIERQRIARGSKYASIPGRSMPPRRRGWRWELYVVEVALYLRRDRTVEPFRNGAS